jgi:hypothetical protein
MRERMSFMLALCNEAFCLCDEFRLGFDGRDSLGGRSRVDRLLMTDLILQDFQMVLPRIKPNAG